MPSVLRRHVCKAVFQCQVCYVDVCVSVCKAVFQCQVCYIDVFVRLCFSAKCVTQTCL